MLSRKQKIARRKQVRAWIRSGSTVRSIAKELRITTQSVYNIRNQAVSDIKARDPLLEKYPSLGKMSGRDRNRERVRIRDKHTCQHCGRVWHLGERRFDIHHLDCNKDKTRGYDGPEEFASLKTLCHSCHMILHAKIIKEKKRV